MQKITNSEDGSIVDYNYDAANRLTRKVLPNGISTVYQYDGMSRLTRLRDFKTNPDTTQTNLYNRQYSYNTASNISQIKIGNQTKDYNYDLIDRLIAVTASNNQNESYGYDGVGNRLTSHLSTTYQYAAFNRLNASQQASFVYDNNGNMTSRTDASGVTQYVWDFENRLRQVIKPEGTSVNYKYNALGQRTERYIGANSTKFTYDGEDVLLDVNSDGTFVKYVNGLGIDDKIRQTVNGQTQYFVQDHLGSTNALTDASGNVISSATYDSFGNSTGNLATRYGYTGREKDADTGLTYYRNRWYDSNLGRFISEDPIGLSGGINQFGYVGGNPIRYSDFSGLNGDDKLNYHAPTDLGLGWRARVDPAISSSEKFEIHIYSPGIKRDAQNYRNYEVGVVSGRFGWLEKHGKDGIRPPNIPDDVLHQINGLNVQNLRDEGIIPQRGIANATNIYGEEVSGNIKGARYLFQGRVMYGMGITVGILGLFNGLFDDYEIYQNSQESGCPFGEQLRRETQDSEYLNTPFGVIKNPYYAPEA